MKKRFCFFFQNLIGQFLWLLYVAFFVVRKYKWHETFCYDFQKKTLFFWLLFVLTLDEKIDSMVKKTLLSSFWKCHFSRVNVLKCSKKWHFRKVKQPWTSDLSPRLEGNFGQFVIKKSSNNDNGFCRQFSLLFANNMYFDCAFSHK